MRRCGWLVAVPLTPVVLVGVGLTVSIFAAILGLPVLLLTARPWWACLSVGLGRARPSDWSRSLRIHLGLCLAVAALVFLVSVGMGFDDLEDLADGAIWLTFALMLASAAYGGTRLLAPQ